MSVWPACSLFITCVEFLQRPEQTLDPLELELQTVVSHCVVARKQTQSSGRAAHVLNH